MFSVQNKFALKTVKFVFLQLITITQGVVINTENGMVEGREAYTSTDNKTYYVFQGIPYAKPPVENLRFQAPKPAENWQGILSAKKERKPCIQGNQDLTVGEEDCLYLNVYTPQLPNVAKPLLPVMVWIYGGGFEVGSCDYNSTGPDYFLEENIVFVSFNYRLGIFGFLSLGDLTVPGNYGLKDQNLALRWVKQNIIRFGGNPDSITIFGQSAGAASVSYHILSPLSKGLFNRAIMESGTSYCLWSYSRVAPDIAKEVATNLNIDTSSSQNIVAKLRNIDAEDLQETAVNVMNRKFLTVNPRDGLIYAPVLEPKHPGAFMTGRSYQLIKSGNFNRVPAILGYNSLEGTTTVTSGFRLFLLKYDLNPSYFVPVDMNIKNSVIKHSVGQEIKFQYFGLIPAALSNYRLIEYISDDQFVRPIQKFAKMMAKYTKSYLYEFSYEGGLGGRESRILPGVAHGEEMGYMFQRDIDANETDSLTRSRMVRLWTNFAKYGNPTPVLDPLLQNQIWLPIDVNSTDVNYLNIDNDITASVNPKKSNIDFWTKLYDRYGQPPYDTY